MQLQLTIAILMCVASRVALAEPIAIINATIHPVSSQSIEDGVLVFDKDEIKAIGKAARLPAGARKIDMTGRHIYPGLVSAYSQLGLVEIGAVRATRDFRETGTFNPNAVAYKAVNPDSELIPVARSNGILYTLVAPESRRIGGQSSFIKLDGWTIEGMLKKTRVGMHISWPRRNDQDDLKELTEHIESAKQYDALRNASDSGFDIRLEAMQPLVRGEQPMVVEANRAEQIRSAVAFAARHKLKMIVYGGYEAEQCSTLLKEHDIPVILSAIYRLPARRGDAYDAAYTLPARLKKAGVKFCIAGDGSSPSNLRNLPYHAATAVAYGLPREEAIRAITLYPAEILGFGDRIGSLEVGKTASFIITDGDPLEIPTQVMGAYIDGKLIELNDRHKQLYRKWKPRR